MLEKYAGESALFDIDCTDLLAAGETITGTPTMASSPSTPAEVALTIGTPAGNTQAVTYSDGRTAAIGKAIQVRISGGMAKNAKDARAYSVKATFTTSAGNTLVAAARLNVLAEGP